MAIRSIQQGKRTLTRGSFSYYLFRAEDPVAGVAQTGNDVLVLVQTLVNRCDVDIHVRMGLLNGLNALGAADQAHQGDGLAAALLDEVDGMSGNGVGYIFIFPKSHTPHNIHAEEYSFPSYAVLGEGCT